MTRERQLTFGNYGHMLNRRQAVSPDGQWAVYDTRNEDPHIARTDGIEMVHLDSGEVVSLYRTPTRTLNGPGVGAAAFHPLENQVAFIHGLESCSNEKPYSAARRFGAIVQVETPGKFVHAEGRIAHNSDGSRIRLPGVLSGGTHAHSWSQDGWLSFTYNDAWLEQSARIDSRVRDLRTIGFMRPGQSAVEKNDGESFSGTMQAFLAASVGENARPGSDEIEQAVEECWIGKNGYIDQSGQPRGKSLAFQGAVRNGNGELIQEVYLCDVPDTAELKHTADSVGTLKPTELLEAVSGCRQRRLTHTESRKYPGVQGVRNWLVSSPDGKFIYAPMRDDRRIAQLNRIDILSGHIDQVTHWEHSMEGQISINSSGTVCSNICDQRVCLTHIASGKTIWLTERTDHPLSGAVHFVGEHRLVYNRFVQSASDGFMQVVVCEME